MVVLGVDLGERRIGLAVTDALGVTARPLGAIEHRSLADDVLRVEEAAQRQGASRIVVGLPLNLDGTAGPAARRARRFANALRRRSSREVVLWDERLTTVEAQERLAGRREPGQSGRGSREPVDEVAAAVLLQDYLGRPRAREQR
jgi:putative Holliday junction resolvase